MKRERGFLILKGDFERKSVKEKAPGRVVARLGASVYRSVKWGNAQGTASAVRPFPRRRSGGGIKTIAPPNLTWALFLRNFVILRGLVFTINTRDSLLHQIENLSLPLSVCILCLRITLIPMTSPKRRMKIRRIAEPVLSKCQFIFCTVNVVGS